MPRSPGVRRAAILVALTAGGCLDPGDRPASWSYIHPAIVVPSCATATCHSALGERAGIVLEDPDDAFALLRDERFVVPGDPTSPLLFVLEGDEQAQMPPDAPLPAVDVDLIRTWIVDGAAR
jgi:Planctomycete cytochrome C